MDSSLSNVRLKKTNVNYSSLAKRSSSKSFGLLHNVDRGAKCLSCGDMCPGFQIHFWRKVCQYCRCPPDSHDIDISEPECPETKESDALMELNELTPGTSEKAPGTPSMPPAVKNMRTRQNPGHDKNENLCSSLDNDGQKVMFRKLCDKRAALSGFAEGVDPATVPETAKCGQCAKAFTESTTDGGPSSDIVKVDKTETFYHSDCLICNKCEERLVDNAYSLYENRPHCCRCFGEKLLPRCAGCDELIFHPSFTSAEGQQWHKKHFCCWKCDDDLSGKSYGKNCTGSPHCVECYNNIIAVSCSRCSEKILLGSKAVKIDTLTFHKENCFSCFDCKKPLEASEAYDVDGSLYCPDDYDKRFGLKCSRCTEPLGEDFIEVASKNFHPDCFSCEECGKKFGDGPKDGPYPVESGKLLCHFDASCFTLEKQKQLARGDEPEGAGAEGGEKTEATRKVSISMF